MYKDISLKKEREYRLLNLHYSLPLRIIRKSHLDIFGVGVRSLGVEKKLRTLILYKQCRLRLVFWKVSMKDLKVNSTVYTHVP